MMKKLLPCLLFIALSFSAPVLAYEARDEFSWSGKAHENPIYKELSDRLGKLTQDQMVQLISVQLKTVPSPDDLKALIVFTYERSYGEEYPERVHINYFLMHSDAWLIYGQTAQEEPAQVNGFRNALGSMHAYEMLAMSDGLRCKDTEAWNAFRSQVISPRIRTLSQAYTTLQPAQYQQMAEDHVRMDDLYMARPENTGICGMTGQSRDLFIDTYGWHARREQVHAAIRETWYARYKQVTGVSLQQEKKRR